MSYTKRQFVTAALEELGLASYVYDLQPEQLESAMRRLDGMMAEWNGKGIRLGYPIPGSPENSALDSETDVPDSANEAVISNLAIRLAPSYGKQVMMQTMVTAKNALNVILSRATMPMEMQMPATMPSGAGNKNLDRPFMPVPTDPLLAGQDGPIEFE